MNPIAGKVAIDVLLTRPAPSGLSAKLFSKAEWTDLREVESLAVDEGKGVSAGWYRVDAKEVPTLPDGFDTLVMYEWGWRSLAPFFDPTNTTLFEAKGKDGGVSRSKPRDSGGNARDLDDWLKSWTTTNARVERAKDGKTLKRLFFTEHRVVEEREVTDTTEHYLLDFDDAGRLARVRASSKTEGWRAVHLITFERDAKGRITSVRQRGLSGGTSDETYTTGMGGHDLVLSAKGPAS